MGANARIDTGWTSSAEYVAGREQLLNDLARAVLGDMRRGTPVDTGALLNSLDYEIVDDTRGRVARVGSRDVEHSTYVELGTGPHTITSHGPWPLRNRETGQVFGRTVHHPGTPAQPYMRPALYRKRG